MNLPWEYDTELWDGGIQGTPARHDWSRYYPTNDQFFRNLYAEERAYLARHFPPPPRIPDDHHAIIRLRQAITAHLTSPPVPCPVRNNRRQRHRTR